MRGSTLRTLTTSFGSVCFGSFLVAIISTLKALVESLRQDRDNDGAEACLLCCLDCILGCIENIAELFNRYVSLIKILKTRILSLTWAGQYNLMFPFLYLFTPH